MLAMHMPGIHKWGGGVWYSRIQKAIMEYSLFEDSYMQIEGHVEALKEVLDE